MHLIVERKRGAGMGEVGEGMSWGDENGELPPRRATAYRGAVWLLISLVSLDCSWWRPLLDSTVLLLVLTVIGIMPNSQQP